MYKDATTNEYYIDVKDVLDNTMYSEDELGRIFGDNLKKAMKLISRTVYQLIYSVYRGANPYKHKQFMQTKIENNTMDEQLHLKLAVVEMVKGAMQSGMDLNAYLDDAKTIYPYTVKRELNAAGLLNRSEKYL